MVFINSLPGAVAQGLIWGVMAIGLYISYKILDFADLTVDGSFATGGIVCAVFLLEGVNPYLAFLLSFLAGALAGLITALFHTAMKIPAILSGILTQLILWSLNLVISGGRANLSLYNLSVMISQRELLKAILVSLAVTGVLIALLYWFFGTEIGCSIRATGSNEIMARAQGVNTSANKIIALMISNGLVAMSGALLSQYQAFADINMGRGAIVIGLASIIVGTAIVRKISKNFAVQLIGSSVGAIVYYIVFTLIICLDVDTNLLKMFSAVVVAVFLAVPNLREHYKKVKIERKEN